MAQEQMNINYLWLNGNLKWEEIFNEMSKNNVEMPSHKTRNMEMCLDIRKELG